MFAWTGPFIVVAALLAECSGAPLLPFGSNEGDSCLEVFDDTINFVGLGTPFNYYGTNYNSLYIISNGMITFNNPSSSYCCTLINVPTTTEKAVVLFNDDFQDFGTNLYYRDTTDPVVLGLINGYVDAMYPGLGGFIATSAFVVTWNRINYFAFPLEEATLQMAIVRSAGDSIALFLIDDITFLRRDFPRVGVTNGDGVNYQQLCLSGTPGVSAVDELTQPGAPCPGMYSFILATGQPNTCIPSIPFFLPPGSCPDPAPDIGGCPTAPPPPPTLPPRNSQDERVFENMCANCIVSGGIGFVSDPEDCSCYFICTLGERSKAQLTSSVAYKRCCPCNQSFSTKLLTCVDYTDKRSECFNADEIIDSNPCGAAGAADGDLLPRGNPDDAALGSVLCSGYIECLNVGSVVVPNQRCCPDGQCFSATAETCESSHCDDGYCNTLRSTDDCDCDTTPDPMAFECAFVSDPNDITQFMGRQNMFTYECAAGTCWDQDLCTCVRTNNTGYNECLPFATLDFSSDLNARDGRGNLIYTETIRVERESDAAEFDGDGIISVGGLGNTYLSNDFVFHLKFTLEEDDSSSNGETQCMVGNCLRIFNGNGNDTFVVSVDRAANSDGTNVELMLTYQDHEYMTAPDSMESENYELEGDFELDVQYDFWLIYHGSSETLYAGIIDPTDTLVTSISADVEDSVQLIPNQSGFLFGSCISGDDYEGILDDIEFYRTCFPYANAEFETAYGLLTS